VSNLNHNAFVAGWCLRTRTTDFQLPTSLLVADMRWPRAVENEFH
jgi:hypothetical protein